MEPEQQKPEEMSINDAVATLMDGLPLPVQNFLKSDERDQVTRELTAKYNLHVDQAGDFERAFLFMLLGVATPEEFVSMLTDAGLTSDVISGLAGDVNTRVFMRLRELERQATPSPAPVPQAQPQKPEPLPVPAVTYEAPPAPPTLPGSPVPVPLPTPPPEPTPMPMSASTPPATRTMASDIAALEQKPTPPPLPVAPPTAPAAAPPIVREYGTDPYREPV